MTLVTSFWWILPVVISIVFYKFVLRVFFGMVIVPEDKIGLVTKKFVLFGAGRSLPTDASSQPKAKRVYELYPRPRPLLETCGSGSIR